MASEFEKPYEKAVQAYRQAQASGNRADKVKASLEMREIERAANRDGKPLLTEQRGDRLIVRTQENVPTKRELQGEYIRKFDEEKRVRIADRPGEEPKEQTLREFHGKRLLGRK